MMLWILIHTFICIIPLILRFSEDEIRMVEGSLTFIDLYMVNDITKA